MPPRHLTCTAGKSLACWSTAELSSAVQYAVPAERYPSVRNGSRQDGGFARMSARQRSGVGDIGVVLAARHVLRTSAEVIPDDRPAAMFHLAVLWTKSSLASRKRVR